MYRGKNQRKRSAFYEDGLPLSVKQWDVASLNGFAARKKEITGAAFVFQMADDNDLDEH